MIVEAIEPASFEDAIPALGALVVDATESGASVNFLAGVTVNEAGAWWAARAAAVRDGSTTVFVARDGNEVIGCTLLARATTPNAPHRAEIGKVIVRQAARRRGIGAALMDAAERRARGDGRWLLILDTVTGEPPAAFYEALGWQPAGTIPNFALTPDGRPASTTYYWKDLR